MDKIELRIMGGLGNQLNQYASARYFQNKFNCPKLIIDVGEYDTYNIRNLEINHLVHNSKVAFTQERSLITTLVREGYHVYQKLYRMTTRRIPKQIVLKYFDDKYLCTYIECDYSKNFDCDTLHMYGYFVSAEIALKVRSILMEELWLADEYKSPKFMKYSSLMENRENIGISIRCGEDYVSNNWPICTKDYYLRGLEYILSRRDIKSTKIFIFADDIRKIKNEDWFNSYPNASYVEDISVCESFELLRNCTDYVCSNSSFSWWGSFLTRSFKPTIIHPNKVYSGNNLNLDKLSFYDNLILMDYITGKMQSETEAKSDAKEKLFI